MHFSIPDTKEFSTDSGSSYMGYNVHVNGIFHCTVRYRQLHNLNEQLKKEYGGNLPPFPPKKILALSNAQLEERRVLLEKYVQLVGQDQQLIHTDVFSRFLWSAQQETYFLLNPRQEIDLDVFLMNGYKVTLQVYANEHSGQVLEKVCEQIHLPKEYIYYFKLFLMKRENDGDITIVRKLQNFESPYISQKSIQGVHRLVLRKSYWDQEYDHEIINDRVALNLLYIQTVADVERGWILTSKDTLQELASLQARGAKQEYVDLARSLKYYGFIQFRPSICDYPRAGSNVLVSIGNRELNLRVRLHSGEEMREGSFKVTRMRCWRITTLPCNEDTNSSGCSNENDNHSQTMLELSFEYLMAKDKLQWITISSEQAILMSICLQSMVDELLLKKAGSEIRHPVGHDNNGSWSYMKRDGSSQLINSSASNEIISATTSNSDRAPTKTESISSMKKLTEKLTGVSLKSSTKTAPNPFVENDAFEGIGDDDL